MVLVRGPVGTDSAAATACAASGSDEVGLHKAMAEKGLKKILEFFSLHELLMGFGGTGNIRISGAWPLLLWPELEQFW